MDRRTAKELLHLREWMARASAVVRAGQAAYLDDVLLQEAGDTLEALSAEASARLDAPETTHA